MIEIIKRYAHLLLSLALAITSLPLTVSAATISDLSSSLSNSTAGSTGVSIELTGTIQTTADVSDIEIRFSTTSLGLTKPAGLNLGSATLGTYTGIGSGWTLNTSSASTGLLMLERTATSLSAATSFSIEIDGVTLSGIDDCEPSANGLVDTCHILLETFDSSTPIDDGTTTYTVREDPYFEFTVEGVDSSTTQNGVTSTKTSTPTGFAFGNLDSDTESYVIHKLSIRTNAPRGYRVKAFLQSGIDGTYNNTEISHFGALNATWSTPQAWSFPDGTSPSDNTGWFGANTSDTRLSNWVGGSGKFAPLGVFKRDVAFSDEPETTTKVIYVSYVIGVNALQPADLYNGTIQYSIIGIY